MKVVEDGGIGWWGARNQQGFQDFHSLDGWKGSGTVNRNNEDRDEHVRGRERGHVSHYFS